MQKEDVNKVVGNMLCTGCGTCTITCAQGAITMTRDSIGNIVPKIDADKCIHCGLCQQVCPGIDINGDLCKCERNTVDSIVGDFVNVYVGQATDSELYANSQSGGVVSAILNFLFESNRIDAALVVCPQKGLPYYKIITDAGQVGDSQKSQYISVDLVSGLKDARSFASIAVVGLPCHLEGVQKLQKINSKYVQNVRYKIGLICGGTFPSVMTDVIFKMAKVEKRRGEKIIWRFKGINNYRKAKIKVFEKDDGGALIPKLLDRQIRHEAKHILTPLRCRLCFDKLNLFADIVLGDPWGMTDINKERGNNVIISRTTTGEQLIHDAVAAGDIKAQKAPIEEVIKGQGISNKIAYVANSIPLYEKRGYQLPGWSHCFTATQSQKKLPELDKEFSRYEKLSNLATNEITVKIVKTLRRKLFKGKIKSLIHRLIHLKLW